MARADDPKVGPIRFDPAAHAAIKAAADSAGVSVGSLVRECAERHAVSVAREVARGDLRLRRANAVAAVSGQVVPARSLVVPESVAAMQAKQRRLNDAKARAAAPAKGRRS